MGTGRLRHPVVAASVLLLTMGLTACSRPEIVPGVAVEEFCELVNTAELSTKTGLPLINGRYSETNCTYEIDQPDNENGFILMSVLLERPDDSRVVQLAGRLELTSDQVANVGDGTIHAGESGAIAGAGPDYVIAVTHYLANGSRVSIDMVQFAHTIAEAYRDAVASASQASGAALGN